MEVLQKFLAGIIDWFKVKSPVSFGIIALLLGAGMFVLTNGPTLGVFQGNETLEKITIWGVWLISIMIGSRTTPYLTQDPPLSDSDQEKKK